MIAAACLTSMAAFGHSAEPDWHYAPYRIQCWVAVAPGATADAAFLPHLCGDLNAFAESFKGGFWQFSVVEAPKEARAAILGEINRLDASKFPQHPKEFDKIFVLSIRPWEDGFLLLAREFDVRTRTMGNSWDGAATRLDLAVEAFKLLETAFSPLAIIENVDGGKARLWPRGGSIPVRDRPAPRSNAWDVFLHVANADGSTERVTPIPNTELRTEKEEGGEIIAAVVGGSEPPLSGRRTRLVEPLALLKSREATRVASAESKPDSPNTATQAAIEALEAELVDVVALREILMAKIRRCYKLKQTADANAALAELQKLKTKSYFDQAIAEIRGKIPAGSPLLQESLGRLEAHAAKYLDPAVVEKYRQVLGAEKRG